MTNKRVPTALSSLILICLGMLVLAAPVRAQSTEKATIEKAVENLRELMLAPNRPALEALFADQLNYGHSDGRVQTKQEFVDALVDKKSVFHSITLSDQTVAMVGDLAIVRHRFEADAVSNGKPGHPRISILQVWQKQGGAWKLLVRQAH